jgi:hypothetical protein
MQGQTRLTNGVTYQTSARAITAPSRLAHAIDKVLAAIPLPSCLVPRPTITKDRLTLGMVAGHLPLMKEPRPAGPPTSAPRPSSGPTHS